MVRSAGDDDLRGPAPSKRVGWPSATQEYPSALAHIDRGDGCDDDNKADTLWKDRERHVVSVSAVAG